MQNRVRVRRDRPSVLSFSLAFAVTMLAVYLLTLGVPEKATEEAAAGVRVTRQIDFQGVTVYFADMGAYPDEWRARVAAAEYAGRGAAAVVHEDGGGFHVLGAGYDLEADAMRIAARLKEQEGTEAEVLPISAPGRSLRVTAPEEHAEAIVKADGELRAQIGRMNALALQVDRGEITPAAARTLVRVAASEVRSAGKQLEKFGSADQPVCAGLIGQLNRLESNLASAARRGLNAAELSGKLRCCHVDGMLQLIDFLNQLGKM